MLLKGAVNIVIHPACLMRIPVTTRRCTASRCLNTSQVVGGLSDVVSSRFSNKTFLIQGASRGLGLEYVRQALQCPGSKVVATCRQPEHAEDLKHLLKSNSERLHVVALDATDDSSIARASEQVHKLTSHLDVLVNAAGVLHVPGVLSPETGLSRVTTSNLQTSFRLNAFGPILVSQAFAPLLLNAAKASGATDQQPAIIANMSARVGSIGDNRLGGWYSYRGSKAALNMLTKTMALEFQRKRSPVACLLLHPGTCDTDLTKPFQKNVPPEKVFTRERGVQQLLAILAGITMEDTGRYLAWDGQDIPW